LLTYDLPVAALETVPEPVAWTKTMLPDVIVDWAAPPTVTVWPPAVVVVRITPPIAEVVAVAMALPLIEPVQTAPWGQQAMWPALSAEHIAVPLQQREEPEFNQAQEFEPEGQPVWRLARSRWGSVALSIESSESVKGSRNGRNGEFEFGVEVEVRTRRVDGRKSLFHIAELECGVRCVSFLGGELAELSLDLQLTWERRTN